MSATIYFWGEANCTWPDVQRVSLPLHDHIGEVLQKVDAPHPVATRVDLRTALESRSWVFLRGGLYATQQKPYF